MATTLFPNKYRIKSTRLEGWDYSSIDAYSATICTKQIRKFHNPNFQWQPRFYDHIIRNEKSLNQIRQYIRGNPLKWGFDRNNPKCNKEVCHAKIVDSR